MTIRQPRAKPNTPKRKHALPLPILRRRAKTNPNPYDLIRALPPQTRQSGLHPRIMNLYPPANPSNPPKTPQNAAKWGEKSTKFPPLTPKRRQPPKLKTSQMVGNGGKWGEIKKLPPPTQPQPAKETYPHPKSESPEPEETSPTSPPSRRRRYNPRTTPAAARHSAEQRKAPSKTSGSNSAATPQTPPKRSNPMTTRQLRAQLNAPKRKYTLPLPIPRLRQRPQTLRQEWTTAQANNQPLPGTPLSSNQIHPKRPLPTKLPKPPPLHSPNPPPQNQPQPQRIVRALLPQTHQSNLPPHIMNLHLPAR